MGWIFALGLPKWFDKIGNFWFLMWIKKFAKILNNFANFQNQKFGKWKTNLTMDVKFIKKKKSHENMPKVYSKCKS